MSLAFADALADLSGLAHVDSTWRSPSVKVRAKRAEGTEEEDGLAGQLSRDSAARDEAHEAAAQFGPALADLKRARGDLEQAFEAAASLRSAQAWRLSHAEDSDFSKFRDTHATMLALHAAVERTSHADTSFTAGEDLCNRLALASSPATFAVEARLALLNGMDDIDKKNEEDSIDENDEAGNRNIQNDYGNKGKGIRVPARWLESRAAQVTSSGSTSRQDRLDLERDCVVLNGRLLVGADVGYAGAVVALASDLERALSWTRGAGGAALDAIRGPALDRFARCVLNTANRTHSGGTAFEAVLALFAGSKFAQVTPASERAPPVSISTHLAPFRRCENLTNDPTGESTRNTEIHQAWGLVARIEGSIDYEIKDAEDLDSTLVALRATFVQSVALEIPLPAFHTRLSNDDGCSADHRQKDYAVWEDHDAFAEGVVILTLNEPQETFEEMADVTRQDVEGDAELL